jgi:hypothetical protein
MGIFAQIRIEDQPNSAGLEKKTGMAKIGEKHLRILDLRLRIYDWTDKREFSFLPPKLLAFPVSSGHPI